MDFVMAGVLKKYNVSKPMLLAAMCSLKMAMNDIRAFLMLELFPVEQLTEDFRDDWVREALMACLELGVPVTPQNAYRLLEDRPYFESLLPVPFDSPDWGGASGTEIVRQWWLYACEDYRKYHLEIFKKVCFHPKVLAEWKRSLACHPGSGDRGWFDQDRAVRESPYNRANRNTSGS